MSREAHVRSCERLWVKLPGPTRPIASIRFAAGPISLKFGVQHRSTPAILTQDMLNLMPEDEPEVINAIKPKRHPDNGVSVV